MLPAMHGPISCVSELRKVERRGFIGNANSHPDFWMPPLKELHYFDKLTKAKRVFPPRCRDERDVCFLESMKGLSARPYIDLESYARLFDAQRIAPLGRHFASLFDAERRDH